MKKSHEGIYVIVWVYKNKAGRAHDFEKAYGPSGDWVDFFNKGDGYTGTELHRDTKISNRFMTLDHWISEEAYQVFRQQHLAEYKAIDNRFEALTEKEEMIGAFVRIIA